LLCWSLYSYAYSPLSLLCSSGHHAAPLLC
jgi:hypothetical protein